MAFRHRILQLRRFFFGRRHAVVEFIVSATAAAHAVKGVENCTERLDSLDFRQYVLYSEREVFNGVVF